MVHIMAFTVVGIPFARSLLVWYGMVWYYLCTLRPPLMLRVSELIENFVAEIFLNRQAEFVESAIHSAEAQQPTQKTYRESAWIKCWLDKMPWD